MFYITGLVGTLWSVMWFNLVYETPAQHPRISDYERHYIEAQIAKQSNSGTKVILKNKFLKSIKNTFFHYLLHDKFIYPYVYF